MDPARTEHCGLKLEPKRGLKMEPGAGWLPEGVNYPPGAAAGDTTHLPPDARLAVCRSRAEKSVLHISLDASHVRHAGT